jgi:hypothetical protein
MTLHSDDYIATFVREHYPKDTEALDAFIKKGIGLITISAALGNKYGISEKAIYLISYARWKIEEQAK